MRTHALLIAIALIAACSAPAPEAGVDPEDPFESPADRGDPITVTCAGFDACFMWGTVFPASYRVGIGPTSASEILRSFPYAIGVAGRPTALGIVATPLRRLTGGATQALDIAIVDLSIGTEPTVGATLLTGTWDFANGSGAITVPITGSGILQPNGQYGLLITARCSDPSQTCLIGVGLVPGVSGRAYRHAIRRPGPGNPYGAARWRPLDADLAFGMNYKPECHGTICGENARCNGLECICELTYQGDPIAGCSPAPQCAGGQQTFTASGLFTPPPGCASFRVLAVGGGGALDELNGGPSGAVNTGTFHFLEPVTVNVGAGGIGNTGNDPIQRTGGSSTFGPWLVAPGGDGSTGAGFSTGGHGGDNGDPASQATAGGSGGAAGGGFGTPGATSGDYTYLFHRAGMAPGAGGAGGGPTTVGGQVGGGGGAGGVLIDGVGPTAGSGSLPVAGAGGVGYGAGAGAPGLVFDPPVAGVPGVGAPGVVYVEWDAGGYAPNDTSPAPFTFDPLVDVPLGTVYFSGYAQPTSFDGPLTAWVTGPGSPKLYNPAVGTASSVSIRPGEFLSIQVTTGSAPAETRTFEVHLGTYTATFLVTTRANAPGSVVADFAPTTSGVVRALAQDQNGHLFAGDDGGHLYRFQPDGTPDPDYYAGNQLNGPIVSLSSTPNGRLYVAGGFTSDLLGGLFGSQNLRLDEVGTVDPTWNLALGQPDLKRLVLDDNASYLLAWGAFEGAQGNASRRSFALVDTNGGLSSLGPAFSPGTRLTSVLWFGGYLFVSGELGTVNGEVRHGIVRLTSDGAIDGAFNPAPIDFAASGLLLTTNNRLAVAGSGDYLGCHGLFYLNWDGSLASCGPFAAGTDIHALAPQPGNRLLVGGALEGVGSGTVALARVGVDLGVDPLFYRSTGTNGPVLALQPTVSGKILVGGSFTTFDGQPRQGLVLLHGGE